VSLADSSPSALSFLVRLVPDFVRVPDGFSSLGAGDSGLNDTTSAFSLLLVSTGVCFVFSFDFFVGEVFVGFVGEPEGEAVLVSGFNEIL